jgi:putative ABC transport system permease protein
MFGLIPFVVKNIKRRKLRSWLTIIGIVVGVLAIVSLMSLSQGLQDNITQEFDKLGARKITINSKFLAWGGASESGFTNKDVQEIEKIFDVEFAMPSIESFARFNYNNEIVNVTLTGHDISNLEKYFLQDNIKLLKGDFLTTPKGNQILVGYSYYNDYENLFKKRLDIGNRIKLDNHSYTVVGILDDTGNDNTNKKMYVSIENIREITGVTEETIDKIAVIVKENRDIEIVGQRIEEKLERIKENDDFIVNTPARTAEQQQEILNVVSIVVVGIAAISLLVGGVGIMNSMYTSVVERKKEIGILKAIGARKIDILSIFLLEAGIIGLIGGILGTLTGIGLAALVSIIATQLGTNFGYSINIFICSFGLGFSFIIGVLSGFLPAYQASKQEAIDSLREE